MHEGEPSIGIALQLYYNRFCVYCQPVPGFCWGRFLFGCSFLSGFDADHTFVVTFPKIWGKAPFGAQLQPNFGLSVQVWTLKYQPPTLALFFLWLFIVATCGAGGAWFRFAFKWLAVFGYFS